MSPSDGLGEFHVLEHEQWVLTSCFQRDVLQFDARQLHDIFASCSVSSRGDLADVEVRHNCCAGHASKSIQRVNRSGREFCIDNEGCGVKHREWCLFGWLEGHIVAASECLVQFSCAIA